MRTATGLPWDLGELLEVLHVTLETLNCELLHVLTGLVSYGQWGQKKSSGEKTSVTFCHWRCVGQQELIENICYELFVLVFLPFYIENHFQWLFTFYVDKAAKKLFEVKAYCTITFNGRVFIIFRK